MTKLSELDHQIFRWAPPGSAFRLAQLFEASPRYILQVQAGKQGLPLRNCQGARPWSLRDREHIEEWHRRKVAQTSAARSRALKEIHEGEAFMPTTEVVDHSGLFQGVGRGRRHAASSKVPPDDFKSWARLASNGKPANLLYDQLPRSDGRRTPSSRWPRLRDVG